MSDMATGADFTNAERFTAGPWDLLAYPDGQAFEVEGGGCIVALVHYGDGAWTAYEEGEANAKLIAAAPELYEALNGLLLAYGGNTPPYEAAKAALAKARGNG